MKCVVWLSVLCALVAAATIIVDVSCAKYQPDDTYIPPKVTANRRSFPDKINTICLEGHTYYYLITSYGRGAYSMLAPKLNDDGTPTKCVGEDTVLIGRDVVK